jgi:Poly(ADP-ribose) polymerase catalytic domain
VEKGCEEWRFVEGKMNEGDPVQHPIVRIQRIQNRDFYTKYVSRQRWLKKKNQGKPNELWMKHGTRATNPDVIIKSEEGFDWRFASDGSFYGYGAYFAFDANYSYR